MRAEQWGVGWVASMPLFICEDSIVCLIIPFRESWGHEWFSKLKMQHVYIPFAYIVCEDYRNSTIEIQVDSELPSTIHAI